MNNAAPQMSAPHPLPEMANALRFLAVDMVNRANSGHPGAPMGMAEMVTALWAGFLNFNPTDPTWPNRDRFVLSNGHASALLYALLHLTGYDFSLEDLKNFRQLGSPTPGHPEHDSARGVETTTGPLGQGLANAVGMAMAQKMLSARYGERLFNNKTYVTVGDGCLMEGLSHEAAELAGHHRLKNLIVLFDDNGITIDGPASLASSTNILKRFESYGFQTLACEGHDFASLNAALDKAQVAERPVFIACRTSIGHGSPNQAGTSGVHGSPLGEEETALTRQALGWGHPPFEVPDHIRALWRETAERGKKAWDGWRYTFESLPAAEKNDIRELLEDTVPEEAHTFLDELKKSTAAERPKVATRQAGGACITTFAPHVRAFVSGSADLSPSNNTRAAPLLPFEPNKQEDGRYIHYGVREHAMGAIMNGLSLYGGVLPAGGTFLSFADYMRPAIRLSAMMERQVIYIFTHDSIGLGEDGPTHQPVEHLAMLRATPNLLTLRPADQVETVECWQIALKNKTGPSALILSRQGLPTVRSEHAGENLCAKGGYVLRETENPAGMLLASGSEVPLALETANLLAKENIPVRVVSLPCHELFDAQSAQYREKIIPSALTARVAVEAAGKLGWEKYLGAGGAFVGMEGFGASAPADALYQHFSITPASVAAALKKQL